MTDTARPELLSPAELANKAREAGIAKLLTAGLVDNYAAACIVDVLTKHGFTVDNPPSSAHYGAIDAVFAALTSSQRVALGDWISRQLTGSAVNEWPRWLHTALETAEAGDQIDRA